jgi:hypothetical protein
MPEWFLDDWRFDLVTALITCRTFLAAHVLVIPCLLLTFMVGPVGQLSYLGLRTGLRGTSLAWRGPPRV